MTTVKTNTVSTDLMTTMNGAAKSEKTTTEEAQDRFMTLLVTQMRNQDPLNPLDNAQVTSQLAQLSTVTGIEKLNATMQTLMGSYQSSQTLQAADMIGHGVLVPGNRINLTEGKSIMGVELTDPADSVKFNVLNESGAVIYSRNLGEQKSGIVPIAWDGKTDAGTTAPDGKYTFEVKAIRGGEKVEATALSFGAVSSVTTNAQGVKLNIPGIGDAKLADVRQIL